MELIIISILNGLVGGMLLFMLASGLTLIFSMLGVLNFAHASIYMIGAYLAYTTSQFLGFFTALVAVPIACGLIGAAIEIWGLRRVHQNGHLAEFLFTFGLSLIVARGVQMIWGMLPKDYRVPSILDFPLFAVYNLNFPAYRGFMLLISAIILIAIWLLLHKTRLGLIIQASLTHPDMVSALGHNVRRVYTIVFAGGCALAGLAGVVGGNYLTTEPAMGESMVVILFVVVILGGLGSFAGCFLASILIGMIQSFAVIIPYSLKDLLALLGIAVSGNNLFTEMATLPVARIGVLIPFIVMIAVLMLRPRGLLGSRDL